MAETAFLKKKKNFIQIAVYAVYIDQSMGHTQKKTGPDNPLHQPPSSKRRQKSTERGGKDILSVTLTVFSASLPQSPYWYSLCVSVSPLSINPCFPSLVHAKNN